MESERISFQTTSNTLQIRHLPPELSDERRDQLLKKYHAVRTRTMRKSSKHAITFAEFSSEEIATEAFLRLHQLNVKGQRLSVHFSKESVSNDYTMNYENDNKIDQEPKKEGNQKSRLDNFFNKLNSWTGGHVFMQPPNPSIRYQYPSPKKETLFRISLQLIKEPTFYNQVLHLMNRMNLPSPFEELEMSYPVSREAYSSEKYMNIFGIQNEGRVNSNEQPTISHLIVEDEEEESEIESGEESDNQIRKIIPLKRKRPALTKKVKIPKFVNPNKQVTTSTSSQKPLRPEDLFESVDKKNTKIEPKMISSSSMTESIPFHVSENKQEGGFGLIFPASRPIADVEYESMKAHEKRNREFITSNELASNRISPKDFEKFNVFKNYHPGKSSCRLYIKNLAKQVDLKDLHFIYKKFITDSSNLNDGQFNVQLMQSGRMKGQAFVTLQSIEQAELALAETNGYILKDKPMVVQFSKTSRNPNKNDIEG